MGVGMGMGVGLGVGAGVGAEVSLRQKWHPALVVCQECPLCQVCK